MKSVLSLVPAIALLGALMVANADAGQLNIDLTQRVSNMDKAWLSTVTDEYKKSLESDLVKNVKDAMLAKRVQELISDDRGCSWTSFTQLLDMLEHQTYPIPVLVTIAFAKQLEACNNEVTDLPDVDGLDSAERYRLSLFAERTKDLNLHSSNGVKAMADACLKFMKKDLRLSSAQIKKDNMVFRKTFFEQMNFCFTIESKLHHYFEFVHQVGGFGSDQLGKIPKIAERAKLGYNCHIFVNNNQKIVDKAYRQIAKWATMKKDLKEFFSGDSDDSWV